MADFLDRLKEQVTAGITTVTTKSRVAVETTRLRSQIRRIAKEKRDALAQLGTRAYQEICERGHLEQDRIQEAVQRIQALDHSIKNLEQEITRMEALDAATPWPAGGGENPIATCTCGTPVPEGSKFCGACGANVQEVVAKAAAVHCPRCGAGLFSSAKFCRNCGVAVPEKQEAGIPTEPKQ
jgi:hypothetical protein